MIKASEKKIYKIKAFEQLEKAKELEAQRKLEGWKYMVLNKIQKLVKPSKIEELTDLGWKFI